ncbi:hypothetical protein [Modestobacter versicolor]|uniref:hypothetical protein n=1 Tax=Modestobacter versicolor TaxID=429133 RepID=UPI0034DE6366
MSDEKLSKHAADFVIDTIARSESYDSTMAEPTPDLLPVSYDGAAISEYLAEIGPESDHEGED